MNTIEQILAAKEIFKPGAKFLVEAYVSSSTPQPVDLEVELLGMGDYRQLQERSVEIVNDALSGKISLPVIENVTVPVVLEALSSIKSSLEKSMNAADVLGSGSAAPRVAYVQIGDGLSLNRMESDPEALFLLRLRSLRPQTPVARLEVGSKVAAVRGLVSKLLELPVGSYMHVIKLKSGKFARISQI